MQYHNSVINTIQVFLKVIFPIIYWFMNNNKINYKKNLNKYVRTLLTLRSQVLNNIMYTVIIVCIK